MQPLRASLHPFCPQPELDRFRLSAAARWHGGVLQLDFELSGPLAELVISPQGPSPRRLDGLWQSTCFEAFVAHPDAAGYWEINMAPNGDWNVYALSGYRQGLRPEPLLEILPVQISRQRCGIAGNELLRLRLQLDLTALLDPAQPLEASATAVLERHGQGCSYWAWRHGAAEPDFHCRASFLKL